MRLRVAHPAERRAEVLRLLRETDLPIAEIGARTGVRPGTIKTWNTRSGWVRPPRWDWVLARWPAARRAAVARLLDQPGNDPVDIAVALGFGRDPADLVSAALQLAPRPGRAVQGRARDPAPPIDPPTLRTHLRIHIARQIAAFDAALDREGVALSESARVLRDLGGLRRLLDEIETESARGAAGEGGDDGTARDLPTLRAEIARRYDDFVGGGAPA
ncbi:hypothetical protein SAMN05216360_109128 [Methylobacterium phyllostachyos]|uniref:Homeodomain-like domain-containing protein n=1 Tax=Methylobacterium phyllostachyos TaxID=582672 RepID=A0A1H0CEJ4_9HYPH|nr:hypothetical protein [Methylobacterium phyllostachyos]SDN56272.1 hypothetical protein SAMN05216360_109128 [Methylobacterium phyllostachyos]